MEARFGTEAYQFYGMGTPSDLRAMGKRSSEWDLNNWRWDGDLFIATPINPAPEEGVGRQLFPLGSGIPVAGGSSNSSSSCSEEADLGIRSNNNKEGDKKRRVIVLEDDTLNEEAGTLSLKLGGNGSPMADTEIASWDGVNGKKSRVGNGNSSRSVCQVEDCGADLSKAKDYHRRHKVCEMHSKASKALVGNAMQRFCQQCSRFHLLQEFDEGKRSCRRRLAGHNKRRRKTNNDAVPNENTLNDDQTSSYLLISLLKILSNMHSGRSEQTTDQDLLTQLVRSLASQNGDQGGKNLSNLLQEPENVFKEGTSSGKSEMVSALFSNGSQGSPTAIRRQPMVSLTEMQHQVNARASFQQTVSSTKPSISNSPPAFSEARNSTAGQIKMNNFDLNDIYIDSDDGMEGIERFPVSTTLRTTSLDYQWRQQDSHQSSPPQTSHNSDSASAQSPSSSSGEAQSRTDRIVFKLFGKEPNDFPLVLRAQILDWLSHSPTDIESYIRPGCIVLTIYLRQAEAVWEELYYNLTSSLNRLLDVSDDTFWRTGWVHIRVQHQIAFIFNGQVVIDTTLPFRSSNYGKILSVSPIAVPASKRAQFSVKGVNLIRPATRLMCALEGRYLACEDARESMDQYSKELDELQCIHFSCSVPVMNGRGFIEIEDQGLSSSFFPFIVVEEEDVCSEIRVLEPLLELNESDSDIEGTGKIKAKSQAMDFIHEMGWLIHRSQLKSQIVHLNSGADPFPLKRFKWLMEFSMDHGWCAVVKKLLNLLLDGTVNTGEHPSLDLALSEMGLLHRAVRRNSKSLVELLLQFVPENNSDKLGYEDKALLDGEKQSFLFRPDVVGPAGLTPLHIAAGKDGSEDVLDALTNDPCMVGIEAWKNAHDSTGSTPEDYARLRGHYVYIHLVQKKINKRQGAAQVVVDIPSNSSECNTNEKQNQLSTSLEIGIAEVGRVQGHCKLCEQKLSCRAAVGRSLVYKPAVLSMVAVAAVCVCVALLFKSSPEVLYVFRPFRWESLDFGTS